MRQDAASEERFELVIEELRQVGSGGRHGLREEGRGVLRHQPSSCAWLRCTKARPFRWP